MREGAVGVREGVGESREGGIEGLANLCLGIVKVLALWVDAFYKSI